MVSPTEILNQEERFRELYSELQGITPEGINQDIYELSREGYYDLRKFRELVEELKDTERLLMDVKIEYSRNEPIINTADILLDWLDELERQIDIFCARHYPYMICKEFPTDAYLDFQDEIREEGIMCGLLTREDVSASFVRVVDSFTNCLHSLGLKIAEIQSKSEELEKQTHGVCVLIEEPENPLLIEACRTFADYVDYNKGSYAMMDIGKQKGYIYRDKIQFDVGGQAGHRAEIDLRDKTFRYFDPHSIRPYAVTYAIEEVLGMECESYYDEYTCKPIRNDDQVLELARLLAFIPSVDIWLNDMIGDYKWDHCMPECRSDCEAEGYCLDDCDSVCSEDCRGEENYEECYEECMSDCVDRCCYDYCNDPCEEDARDAVSDRASDAFVEILKHNIDYYDDMLDYIRERL